MIKHLTYSFVLFILATTLALAQFSGVILDKQNLTPIPYASIHTNNSNGVRSTMSTMSNVSGKYTVDFTSDSLVFSHINYQSLTLSQAQLSDTIYLEPVSYMLNEVDVFGSEFPWIKQKLREALKAKEQLYKEQTRQKNYSYETRTLSDSSGYAFLSKGAVYQSKNDFYIQPTVNIIKYKDASAGNDFSNLRRMLYTDFMTDFSADFISDNSFSQNLSYKHTNPHAVQLLYYHKENESDDGYVVIDTLKNAIIEVQYTNGTKSNIRKNNSATLLRVAASMGFHYETWITQRKDIYQEENGTHSLQYATYKLYMATKTENKKVSSSYFISTEAKLTISNNTTSESNTQKFIVLPKLSYIIPIYTKKMRLEEEALQKVTKTYTQF